MRERCKGGDPACLSLSHSHELHIRLHLTRRFPSPSLGEGGEWGRSARRQYRGPDELRGYDDYGRGRPSHWNDLLFGLCAPVDQSDREGWEGQGGAGLVNRWQNGKVGECMGGHIEVRHEETGIEKRLPRYKKIIQKM